MTQPPLHHQDEPPRLLSTILNQRTLPERLSISESDILVVCPVCKLSQSCDRAAPRYDGKETTYHCCECDTSCLVIAAENEEAGQNNGFHYCGFVIRAASRINVTLRRFPDGSPLPIKWRIAKAEAV
jgi:hypothetical protein